MLESLLRKSIFYLSMAFLSTYSLPAQSEENDRCAAVIPGGVSIQRTDYCTDAAGIVYHADGRRVGIEHIHQILQIKNTPEYRRAVASAQAARPTLELRVNSPPTSPAAETPTAPRQSPGPYQENRSSAEPYHREPGATPNGVGLSAAPAGEHRQHEENDSLGWELAIGGSIGALIGVWMATGEVSVCSGSLSDYKCSRNNPMLVPGILVLVGGTGTVGLGIYMLLD